MLTTQAKENNKKVDKYMTACRKSLRERFGRVDEAWNLTLDMLQDQLLMYYSFQDKLRGGQELKFSEIKMYREITASILKLTTKLGVSSPYDQKITRQVATEKKDDEPDYLESLEQ